MATASETIRALRRKNAAAASPAATTATQGSSPLARIAEMRASGSARPIDEILKSDRNYRDPKKSDSLRTLAFALHDRVQGYDIPKFSTQHQEEADPDTAAARKYNQNRTAYDTLAARPQTPERDSQMAILKAEMEQYIQYGANADDYHKRKGAIDEWTAQLEAAKPKTKNGYSVEYERLMAQARDDPQLKAEFDAVRNWTSGENKTARAKLAEDVRLSDEQAAIRDRQPKFDFTTGQMETARTARNDQIFAVRRGQEEAQRIVDKEIKTGRKLAWDKTDRILNGATGIYASVLGDTIFSQAKEKMEKYDYLSDAEKDDFYYYLGTGQQDKAFDYLESLEGRLEDRVKASEQGELRELAEKHPVAGAAGQFVSNFGSPLAVIPQAFGAAKNAIKGDAFFEPAITSGPLNRAAYSAQALNEGVTERITRNLDDTKPLIFGMTAAELARNGYGLVQSMASSAVNVAAFGPASIYVMGAQAAGNTAYSAAERGLSPAQALAIGVGSGVIEALTEKYSVENFLKFFEGGSKMGLKLALKEIGKQMLAEGSEEVAAEVLDTALDMLVAGDMSEFSQYKKQLMAGGMGEDEANSAAIKQFFVNNVLSAGIGGTISGGVFGVGGVVANNYDVAKGNRIAERGAGDVAGGAAEGVTTPARGATPPTEGNGTWEFAPYDDNDGFGTPEFAGYDAEAIREWLIEDEAEDAPDIETAARIINAVARGQLQELSDADFDVLESSPDFADIVAGVDEAAREAADAVTTPARGATPPTEGNGTDGQKFSVQEAPDGTRYVEVDTDQHLFDGVSPREYPRVARQYIRDNFRNIPLQVGANGTVRVSNRSAGEYTHNASPNKSRAATELDNLLKVSEYSHSAPDDNGRAFASDGWDYRTVSFRLDGQSFNGLINIAKSPNGALFYDMTNVEPSAGIGQTKTPSESLTAKSSSANNIPSSGTESNTQNQTQSNYTRANEKTTNTASVAPETRTILNKISETTGVKFNVTNDIQVPEGASDAVRRSDINGWYDPVTRTVNLNTSRLTTDAAILTTALHEVIHDIQQSDPEFHAELAYAVRELMGGRAFDAAFNALPAAYRDMSAETREAEVVANYLQEQFGNEQSMNRMMAEKPGVMRRVLDAIRNWIADVRSRLTATAADRATATQLQQLEQRIGEMMRDAGADSGRAGLDPAKILTANGTAAAYDPGDSANNEYLRDLERIDALPATETEKQTYRDESKRRWDALLDIQIDNPSWNVTGRARINAAKSAAGADKVANARNYAARYVDGIESKYAKQSKESDKARFREMNKQAMKDADARGANSIVLFDDFGREKTAYKTGRSWSFKRPDNFASNDGGASTGGSDAKYSLSDAEATENKRTVAAMAPVATLTGDEFRAGGKTLAAEVAAYYDKLGGSVNNPDIGEISLTRRGAKDSIAHGIGNEKATAFAAVPDVLRKGKIISSEENWKGRGYDSFLIAAPVTIADKEFFEGVVVKATPSMGTQRFYVHEVYANEGADDRSTEFPEQSGVRGGTSAPTVNSVLQDLWNVKREISGGANNAPMYSAADSDYTRFLDAYPEVRAEALTESARELFENAWSSVANNEELSINEALRLSDYAIEQAEIYDDAQEAGDSAAAQSAREKLVSFDDGTESDYGERKIIAMTKAAAEAHRAALNELDETPAAVEVAAEQPPPDAVPAPAPEPIPPRAPTARVVASDGTKIDGRYEVIPAGELITSDTFDGAATAQNPGYPQQLQNRDRSSAGAITQINSISQTPDAERLITRGTDASSGTPIVLADNVVLSGNGRVMGLAQAAKAGRLNEYHDYLIKHADEYGLDPAAIPEDGILVRKIDIPLDEATRLAPIMNTSGTQMLGAREQAATDSAMLEEKGLLDSIDPDAPLTGAENSAFVQAFTSNVPESERNSMLTKDGKLSDSGELRIRNAVFQYVYGDPDLTARLAEDRGSLAARRIVNALVLTAPKFADYTVARGNNSVIDNDIIGDLIGGLELYQALRAETDDANPRTVSEYVAQGKMLRQYSDEQIALAGIMEQLTSEKATVRFLAHYADAANAVDPNQISLTGEQELSMSDIIDNAVRSYNNNEQTTKPLDVPEHAVDAINTGHWSEAPTAAGSHAARSNSVQAISDRFNEELDRYANTSEAHVYNLGKPSTILARTGIPAQQIELSNYIIRRKTSKHEYGASDLQGLVPALREPVAVFKYGKENESRNVIVDLSRNGNNLLVGISFEGGKPDVNDIRTLFHKDSPKWLNWINKGDLLYADINKLQALVDQQRTNLAEVEYLDLENIDSLLQENAGVKHYFSPDLAAPNAADTKPTLPVKRTKEQAQAARAEARAAAVAKFTGVGEAAIKDTERLREGFKDVKPEARVAATRENTQRMADNIAEEFGVRGTKSREKLHGILDDMSTLVKGSKSPDFAKLDSLARSAADLALRRQFPAASSADMSPVEIAEANAALEIAQRELANEILSSFADGRRIEAPGGKAAASRALEMSPEYKNLLEMFGAYPQGEKAARIFPVPKNTDPNDKNKRVSKLLRNAVEASVTPPETLKLLEKATLEQAFTYTKESIAPHMEDALTRVTPDTLDAQIGRLDAIFDERSERQIPLSLQEVADFIELYDQLNNAKRYQDATDVWIKLSMFSTWGGQSVTGWRMLKMKGPGGELSKMEASVKHFNKADGGNYEIPDAIQDAIIGNEEKGIPPLDMDDDDAVAAIEAQFVSWLTARKPPTRREMGSPPPLRGTLATGGEVSPWIGITPARTGNRHFPKSSELRLEDHPRTGFAGGNDLAMSARGVATGVGGGKNI